MQNGALSTYHSGFRNGDSWPFCFTLNQRLVIVSLFFFFFPFWNLPQHKIVIIWEFHTMHLDMGNINIFGFAIATSPSLAPGHLPSLIITERNTCGESAPEHGAETRLQAQYLMSSHPSVAVPLGRLHLFGNCPHPPPPPGLFTRGSSVSLCCLIFSSPPLLSG